MKAATIGHCVFAIHPTSQGFGWIAFHGQLSPYDWGLVGAKRDKNATCVRKIEVLLARFLPTTLVLEAFETQNSSRTERIARLCRSVQALAIDRSIDVAIYTRKEIQRCFAKVGALTRDEIAAAVVRHVDALRAWLPNKRRAWESEHRHIAVFSAAALVITHYHLGASALFEELM